MIDGLGGLSLTTVEPVDVEADVRETPSSMSTRRQPISTGAAMVHSAAL